MVLCNTSHVLCIYKNYMVLVCEINFVHMQVEIINIKYLRKHNSNRVFTDYLKDSKHSSILIINRPISYFGEITFNIQFFFLVDTICICGEGWNRFPYSRWPCLTQHLDKNNSEVRRAVLKCRSMKDLKIKIASLTSTYIRISWVLILKFEPPHQSWVQAY